MLPLTSWSRPSSTGLYLVSMAFDNKWSGGDFVMTGVFLLSESAFDVQTAYITDVSMCVYHRMSQSLFADLHLAFPHACFNFRKLIAGFASAGLLWCRVFFALIARPQALHALSHIVCLPQGLLWNFDNIRNIQTSTERDERKAKAWCVGRQSDCLLESVDGNHFLCSRRWWWLWSRMMIAKTQLTTAWYLINTAYVLSFHLVSCLSHLLMVQKKRLWHSKILTYLACPVFSPHSSWRFTFLSIK